MDEPAGFNNTNICDRRQYPDAGWYRVKDNNDEAWLITVTSDDSVWGIPAIGLEGNDIMEEETEDKPAGISEGLFLKTIALITNTKYKDII